MFKRVVDRTPVMIMGDECEVITCQFGRKRPRYFTALQSMIPLLKIGGSARTLGNAKRMHWQCVDLICDGLGCINIDDNEIFS